MSAIWQMATLAAVTIAVVLFAGFVLRVIWKMMSGEADRLEAARKAEEAAARDDG